MTFSYFVQSQSTGTLTLEALIGNKWLSTGWTSDAFTGLVNGELTGPIRSSDTVDGWQAVNASL
eukprot:COSAG01_NODE_13144_length_1629_cov_1.024183_1_plen_63_part_10